ncbi:MAG TPA: hypothetical protein VFO76_11070 [Candidatus Kapabacteria bacterium]|nr:hypothetical protein [Candidatus Kapabacteria bacterium]
MKKQISIVSMMFVFALSLVLTSCGSKRDEALVAEFNSKKTEAEKAIGDYGNLKKMMSDDHKDWSSKLDNAAKAPKADTMKIADFKNRIKAMDDMMPAMDAMVDSLKAATNAKTETNDELKAAIANVNAKLADFSAATTKAAADHKKLGDDIIAFLGGSPTAESKVEEPAAKGKGKSAPVEKPNAATKGMDMKKHPEAPTQTPPKPTPANPPMKRK